MHSFFSPSLGFSLVNQPEAEFFVRLQGHLQLVYWLFSLVSKLFRGICGWHKTKLLNHGLFTDDQEYYKSSYLSYSQLMPISLTSCS